MILIFNQIYNIIILVKNIEGHYPSEKHWRTIRNVTGNADGVGV